MSPNRLGRYVLIVSIGAMPGPIKRKRECVIHAVIVPGAIDRRPDRPRLGYLSDYDP